MVSFSARHRTICAVLEEIRATANDDRIDVLVDEAKYYAQRMSAKLQKYKLEKDNDSGRRDNTEAP